MKNLIIIPVILCFLEANSQVITFNFRKLKNEDVRKGIVDNQSRFKRSLRQFSPSDTINIEYNVDFVRDYIVIRHNIKDDNKIYFLYLNFIVYCAFQKQIVMNDRMEDVKIYVRQSKDRYYYSDYEYLQINEKPIKVYDRLFK